MACNVFIMQNRKRGWGPGPGELINYDGIKFMKMQAWLWAS